MPYTIMVFSKTNTSSVFVRNLLAVDIVLPQLGDPQAAAYALVTAALAAGSQDNVTATVIVFPWARIHADELYVAAAAEAIALATAQTRSLTERLAKNVAQL